MTARNWLFVMLLSLVPSVDWATTYDVRTDGSDSNTGICAGTPDSTCAKATVASALAAARVSGGTLCGDTVRIGSGQLVEPYDSDFSFTENCSATGGFTLQGAGITNTTWMPGYVPLTGCSLTSGSIYTCTTASSLKNSMGIMQAVLGTVTALDDNGVTTSMDSFVRVTGRQTDDVATQGAGTFYRPTASTIKVWGWNSETPVSTSFWDVDGATGDSTTLDFSTASNTITVRDMTLVPGQKRAFNVAGDNITILNVTIYGSEIWTTQNSDNLVATNVKVHNAYRRCSLFVSGSQCAEQNMDGADDWGFSSSAWITQGSNFHYTDIETHGSRNGFSVSQNTISAAAACGDTSTVDRFKFHGHHNHGFQVGDYCRGITFTNGETWGQQEGLFLSGCAHDITLANVTLVAGSIITNTTATACTGSPLSAGGQWNITICNSILARLAMFGSFDGRTGVNYDTFNNLYVSGQDYVRITQQDCSFATPTDYRNWTKTGGVCVASDPCTNCTRDTNTLESTKALTFTSGTLSTNDDVTTRDLSLQSTSSAINGGTSACYSGGVDINGNARTGNPDIGAYEYGTASPSSTFSFTIKGAKVTGVKAQ